ncbi:MAG: DUF6753 family protein [Lyngbya sp.]|nr:DUF6753 family protein [Lyngbya sp.]
MSLTQSQWIERNQKALTQLLECETDEAKAWVDNFLKQSGSALEDPFCVQIATNAYLAYVIRNKPDEIRSAFEIGESKLFKSLGQEFDAKKDSYEQALSAELEARIARMAERLLDERTGKPVTITQPNIKLTIAVPIGCLVGIIVGLSSGFIVWGSSNSTLSVKDAQMLNWAKSKPGVFARQLMEWNGSRLVTRNCEAEAKTENITLAVDGIQATRGVCAVFVRDPRETQPQQY